MGQDGKVSHLHSVALNILSLYAILEVYFNDKILHCDRIVTYGSNVSNSEFILLCILCQMRTQIYIWYACIPVKKYSTEK